MYLPELTLLHGLSHTEVDAQLFVCIRGVVRLGNGVKPCEVGLRSKETLSIRFKIDSWLVALLDHVDQI